MESRDNENQRATPGPDLSIDIHGLIEEANQRYAEAAARAEEQDKGTFTTTEFARGCKPPIGVDTARKRLLEMMKLGIVERCTVYRRRGDDTQAMRRSGWRLLEKD